jgi:uncharacterized membrane protein
MAIRKKTIHALIFMMILAIGVACVFHDYNWYDTTIVKIDDETHSLIKETANGEKKYEQTLTGHIMNGPQRGQEVQLQNKYSSSGVYDDKYQPGDELFVESIHDQGETLAGSISGLKRDKFLSIQIALFALLLFIVTGKKGIFSIASLLLNISVFCFALEQYGKGHNIFLLSNLLVLFFTISSLFFISGKNKKTLAAVLSTIVTLSATMLLFKLVIAFTNGIDYSYLLYVQNHDDLTEIFLSQILLGGLGAIMDVAVTEASTINELVEKNSEISLRELIRSGREVGHDIMGTMINVMLFTYICGSIPLIILKMNNDIKFHTIIKWHMPMEIDGFLIESIGILLTIPVSLLISVILFRKLRRNA